MSAAEKKTAISEGDVFVTPDRGKFRRIVGVIGDVCCYSIGSDKNRFCQVKTLRRWIRQTRSENKRGEL